MKGTWLALGVEGFEDAERWTRKSTLLRARRVGPEAERSRVQRGGLKSALQRAQRGGLESPPYGGRREVDWKVHLTEIAEWRTGKSALR